MNLRVGAFFYKSVAGVAVVATLGGVRMGVAQGFRTEALVDPVLNMKAYDVIIPAGWKYEGVVMPGSSCDETPTPVVRAYSPDGLSEFRRMPRFDWNWSNAPYRPASKGDCLALSKDISARDFLVFLAKKQNGENLRESPVAQGTAQNFRAALDADNAAIQRQAGQRPFRGDLGAVRFEYANGSFTIEEQLRVTIRCTHADLPGLGGQRYFEEKCGANVRALRAPKGKLDALVQLCDNNRTGPVEDGRWTQAYMAKRQAVTNGIVGSIHANMEAQRVQFAEAQRVRAQQNAEYQGQQQGRYATQRDQAAQVQQMYADHNGKVMANMDARHTPASDTVDFALDQQTVSGSNGTVKVPANYSQVWANEQGQYFLTNNLSTNPNGSLPGNWTQQTQVHGNGRPY